MPVTLADIAAAAGVSRMTVSRALRGHAYVAQDVRTRVREAASSLGWRPDPVLSRAFATLRRRLPRSTPEPIAVVWPDATPAQVAAAPTLRTLRAAMVLRADALGFGIQEFHLVNSEISPQRLSRMLHARGVDLVILAPVSYHARLEVPMEWKLFASVVIGVGFKGAALHRVHNHHPRMMIDCLAALCAKGHRRIGLALPRETSTRLNGMVEGAFLSNHPLGPRAALGLLHVTDNPWNDRLRSWCRKARPEVVIFEHSLPPEPFADRRKRGATGPLFVTFNQTETPQVAPGMNERFELIGEAAVDAVVAQYHRNERGIPASPRTILTVSEWREGFPWRLRL